MPRVKRSTVHQKTIRIASARIGLPTIEVSRIH